MKKLICFFTSTIIMTQLSHAKFDPDRPLSQPNRCLSLFESVKKDIFDFTTLESLGYQALKKKNEQYIRNIIDSLTMNDYCIEIRGMSNGAQKAFGRTNAFVVPTILGSKKSHAYLYISEDWFETLSEDQKQSLIRHELMHLKHDHGRKRVFFSLTTYLLTDILFKYTIKIMEENKFIENKREKASEFLLKTNGVSLAFVTIWLLAVNKFLRYCEKQADIEAAKTMESKEGFVDLFNEIKANVKDPKSQFVIKRIFRKMLKPLRYVGSFFRSHPKLNERINYIQELA